MNTWFISDPHYGHKNIVRGVSSWSEVEHTRDFATIQKMNDAIVESINSNVMWDDVLYCLGDWSFGGIENIWNFRKRINCNTIHLICGNHDEHIKKNKLLPNCYLDNFLAFKDASYSMIKDMYSHVYAKDLFSSVNNYLELTINKQIFVLSHYPLEQWYEMDRRGSIMLHGHTHHLFDNNPINIQYRRMDVGIDWEEFRPYSLEEIMFIMSNRKYKKYLI